MPRDPHLRLTSGLTCTCLWLSPQLTLWMVHSDPCPHFLCCSMISFCPVCGKGVKGSFKFCPFCGNSLPVEEHAEAQTVHTPPVSSFRGRSQQSPAPSCSFLQLLVGTILLEFLSAYLSEVVSGHQDHKRDVSAAVKHVCRSRGGCGSSVSLANSSLDS